MTEIRVLQSVAGPDVSWVPGDVVDLPPDEAQKWADGYRAEYVTPPEPEPAVEAEPEPEPVEEADEVTDRRRDRETTDTPRARTTKRRTR